MPAPNSVPRFMLPENSLPPITVSAANTARDGTGTIVDLITAGAQGTMVELIRAQAVGTTTVGVLRVFIHNGVSYNLYKEILVTAIVPSTSVEAFSAELTFTKPLVLPSGYKIGISTHNAEAFRVFAHAGNY
jgi:hypothetical protein